MKREYRSKLPGNNSLMTVRGRIVRRKLSAGLPRREAALWESQQRYAELVDSIDGIVWEADARTFQFTFVSKRAERLLGYPVARWLHEPNFWAEHVHPDDREWAITFCQQATAENRDHEFEYRMLAADGRAVWLRDIVTVIANKNEPVKLRGVMVDITERKRMEAELLKASKLESLGLLAGGIAHDFNNSLTAIVLNTSLIKMQSEDARLLGRLDEIERAALLAQDLTQQLLTFSKGGTPVVKTSSIGDFLKASAIFASRGSNVLCKFSLPAELWSVDIDEGQINQVINNLIINAKQAMPEGGHIIISAENIIISENDVFSLPAGRFIKISIKDHGVGIPSENLGKIFDPYFTTKETGSGLGLAVCYSIIKKHNGYLTVESEVGLGTTFHIYLPAAKGVTPAAPSEPVAALAGQGRILVMDDKDVLRELMREALGSIGYEVTVAQEGQEVIALYRESQAAGRPYDALILDLIIPGGMGGKEVIKALRKLDPRVKALASSGYASDEVVNDCRQHGFHDVIIKPYRINDLLNKLNRLMAAPASA